MYAFGFVKIHFLSPFFVVFIAAIVFIAVGIIEIQLKLLIVKHKKDGIRIVIGFENEDSVGKFRIHGGFVQGIVH